MGSVVSGIGNAIGGVAQGIGNAVGGVAAGVGSAVGGVAAGVGSAVGGVAAGVGAAVGGTMNAVGGLIGAPFYALGMAPYMHGYSGAYLGQYMAGRGACPPGPGAPSLYGCANNQAFGPNNMMMMDMSLMRQMLTMQEQAGYFG